MRRGWKQSQEASFAVFPGAKWPIFTRIVAIVLLGQPFWQAYEYTINHQKKVIEFVRR